MLKKENFEGGWAILGVLTHVFCILSVLLSYAWVHVHLGGVLCMDIVRMGEKENFGGGWAILGVVTMYFAFCPFC